MKIGKKLGTLRRERKMTLKELSEKSSVQVATLSRMEHDKMTGTLESHIAVCKALGIPLSDFYREIENDHKDVTLNSKASKIAPVTYRQRSAVRELLATKLSEKKIMPVLLRLNRDAEFQEEKFPVGTEKFLYTLGGKVRLKIGSDDYSLRKGDSIYFDASLPHKIQNIARIESLILYVASPPFV